MNHRNSISKYRAAGRAFFFAAALALSAFVALPPALRAQLPVQPPPPQGPADTAAAAALELFNAPDKTKEAIAAYEKLLKDFPTSMQTWEATFRLGALYFRAGDYDKATAYLQKIKPPAAPEIQELALAFLPQVSLAKAAKLAPDDPKRKDAYLAAVKQYDTLIKAYPQSEQMERMVYLRSLALFQAGNYDDAATGLRSNVQKFPSSESISDSKYLLSIDLGAQAVKMLQADPTDPKAFANYDEAQKLLADIILKHTDVAVANDAQLELGEILLGRASFESKTAQTAAFTNAIEALRAVASKDLMIRAQKERIAAIQQNIRASVAARNPNGVKHFQRLLEDEQDKLADLDSKGDQTVKARIKIAQAFCSLQEYDASRQILNDLQPFVTDDGDKKVILYYKALTYAGQNDAAKAVAAFDDFKAKYKNDPIAVNLPLVLGSMFLNTDPKVNDPAKAIQYFKEEQTDYPKGPLLIEALNRQAAALVQLKKFDEALGAFKSLLATNPSKEIAAAAQMGMASVYMQTGKMAEALAEFKNIADKYAGTPTGEQAAFYIGQIDNQISKPKDAADAFTDFIKKYPQSQSVPGAMFYLAGAQNSAGDTDAAVAEYKALAEKFPKSDVAQFSFFQRAQIAAQKQNSDQVVSAMKEFMAAYPDSDKLFYACDTIGQNQVNGGKLEDAIATYEDFADKHAKDPSGAQALLKVADLWRRYAEGVGRYMVLNEQQRVEWTKGVNNSIAAAEKLIQQYPTGHEVALALQTLLTDQKLLLGAKLKTDEALRQYFTDLGGKFQSNPAAKSKVLFTLASYIYETDKAKAVEQMNAAYDPKLVYAPADLDLYGSALVEQKKIPEAQAVFKKLAADFPNPPGVAPDKASLEVQTAQSISLYGEGKCLQAQGNTQGAGQAFDNLKKWYPWSPKILEANFGIAQSLYDQKKYDQSLQLLIPIMRAQSASATAELRANAMLLGGRIQEDQKNIGPAIDYYIKIASFYEGVPSAAAEGLWRGGQLLEKQAATLPDTGEVTKSGQLAKAVKAYKDLTVKYPTSQYAPQAAQRLAAMGKK